MNLNQITLAPIFPAGLILFLFFLGCGAVAVQSLLMWRRLGPQKALFLSALRLLTFALLLCFALNPSRIEKKVHPIAAPLAILLDTSGSMNHIDEGEQGPRLDSVKTALLHGETTLLKRLGEKFDVRLYGFNPSLRPLTERDLRGLKGESGRGDLNAAIGSLRGRNRAVVLFSDGNLRWDETRNVDLPLFIVPAGDPNQYRDVLIQGVKAPSLAFRGKEVVVEIEIKSYGFAGVTLPVVLKEGEKVLKATNVRIPEDKEVLRISLSFTPEKIGGHVFQVSLPVQAGERLSSNNHFSFSLKVVKDKIRILMISGTPSLGYRFLRNALKNDPSIDLLSFVILRTPTDILNVPLQEQSLIPFPVETLFTRELGSFDLLLLDNLPSHLYILPAFFDHVRDFVNGGGGLALIGGPHLLDGGRYARTAIEALLPIQAAGRDRYLRGSPWEVRLSRHGVSHPLTRLLPDETENIRLWREMPSLNGINLVEPKPNRRVLLESGDGSSHPVLTVGEFGRGRVLVLATDDSWKWYMGKVAQDKGNWAYLRFVERFVRWLTRDPGFDPVQIDWTGKEADGTREAAFRIRVDEAETSHPAKGPVQVSVFSPEGGKVESRLTATERQGEYRGSFLPEKEGVYRVRVEASSGTVEDWIAVRRPEEDRDLYPDHDRLKRLAAVTKGKVLSRSGDLLKAMESLGISREGFIEERHTPLWGTAPVFFLLLLLLGTEWYVRRKWGLV